jgi:hypothetical protein
VFSFLTGGPSMTPPPELSMRHAGAHFSTFTVSPDSTAAQVREGRIHHAIGVRPRLYPADRHFRRVWRGRH